MNTQRDSGEGRPATETEVDLTGYDPYIVAITGGASENSTVASEEDLAESRKVKLMAWLRDNRKQL